MNKLYIVTYVANGHERTCDFIFAHVDDARAKCAELIKDERVTTARYRALPVIC